ncbi:DUF4873 domain-containing protein [Actinacidiphila glaucinigra]|uniref:DUF4873 domain-containing protein n=1 Tax=Actinacidiphila glaucinigra TaxID=235986 RepID=UPI002DD83148|nr:DUF4873 domain-containing protein [Actinacidiphila glaucinigra]WSD62132.1 DUF4873 domain-containing protein [Actinacidiphila glaucinigra]
MTAHGPEPDHGHGHGHGHGHDEDGYAGPATLLVAGHALDVEVRLTGYFQPLDGRYHWYGRLAPDARLSALAARRPVPVTVCTPHGRAEGELSDPDLWQRLRVEGTSTPPFTAMATPGLEN